MSDASGSVLKYSLRIEHLLDRWFGRIMITLRSLKRELTWIHESVEINLEDFFWPFYRYNLCLFWVRKSRRSWKNKYLSLFNWLKNLTQNMVQIRKTPMTPFKRLQRVFAWLFCPGWMTSCFSIWKRSFLGDVDHVNDLTTYLQYWSCRL